MSRPRTPESRPDQDARSAGRSAVHSLRSVRLAVVLTIVLMTVVALTIIGYLAGEVRERHVSSSRSLALSVGQTVDEMVGSIDATLLVSADEIAHQIAEERIRPAAITRFLERQQERFPFIHVLRATNAAGEAIYGQGVDPERRVSFAHRSYFRQLRDDPNLGLFIAEPLIGGISQRWSWLMARPIPQSRWLVRRCGLWRDIHRRYRRALRQTEVAAGECHFPARPRDAPCRPLHLR